MNNFISNFVNHFLLIHLVRVCFSPKQPMMIYSFEFGERFVDELSPTDEKEETNDFSSMELTPEDSPKKREAKPTPIIGLIIDILDTVYKSNQSDLKRKGGQLT